MAHIATVVKARVFSMNGHSISSCLLPHNIPTQNVHWQMAFFSLQLWKCSLNSTLRSRLCPSRDVTPKRRTRTKPFEEKDRDS